MINTGKILAISRFNKCGNIATNNIQLQFYMHILYIYMYMYMFTFADVMSNHTMKYKRQSGD